MKHRKFVLNRKEDETGISGTGWVAEGVVFSDGTVALRWITDGPNSTGVYPSLEAVEKIHGHDGKTEILMESAGLSEHVGMPVYEVWQPE